MRSSAGGDWAQALGETEPKPVGGALLLIDTSVACRYLAAQCQVRQAALYRPEAMAPLMALINRRSLCQVRLGLFQEALETLGPSNPFAHLSTSSPHLPSDGGIKLEASMCFLRGTIHLQLGATELAKAAFVEALALEVRCYDAFLALVGGEMMSVDEGACYPSP